MRAAAAARSISAMDPKELGWNKNNSIEFSRSIFKLIMEILFVVAQTSTVVSRGIDVAVVSNEREILMNNIPI